MESHGSSVGARCRQSNKMRLLCKIKKLVVNINKINEKEEDRHIGKEVKSQET